MRVFLITGLLLIPLVGVCRSQANLPSTCIGAVLNGRATYMPMPFLPLEFKDSVGSAMIHVRIETNEQGYVRSAKACSGPEKLRTFYEQAAGRVRISPSGGKPASISGLLVYRYDPKIFFDLPYQLPCPPTMAGLSAIMNGYARQLVKPLRPDSERTSRLSGSVSVQILIGENGRVESAQAVSGAEQFRQAAIEAARQTIFPKFERCGQPAKLSGVLTYNFPLP